MSDWKLPKAVQPRPGDYGFDLDEALSAVVGLSALVPSDAFTAETLGTERSGHGVLIRESGLVLTIGYLVTEAASIWLTLADGRVLPGDVVAIDGETGFALVQILSRSGLPALPLGRSADADVGSRLVVAGGGGRARAVAARVVARHEFAGYWEYVLDDALFTAPVHPNWGGTAAIDDTGRLVGIGSLQLQQDEGGKTGAVNMVVPVDHLTPILDELLATGRRPAPPRPWLGVFATEVDDHVAIAGLASGGPADRAGLQPGDVVLAAAGQDVTSLAPFFRAVWSLGTAGVEVPLRILRGGRPVEVSITSTDRRLLLKKPRLH